MDQDSMNDDDNAKKVSNSTNDDVNNVNNELSSMDINNMMLLLQIN